MALISMFYSVTVLMNMFHSVCVRALISIYMTVNWHDVGLKLHPLMHSYEKICLQMVLDEVVKMSSLALIRKVKLYSVHMFVCVYQIYSLMLRIHVHRYLESRPSWIGKVGCHVERQQKLRIIAVNCFLVFCSSAARYNVLRFQGLLEAHSPECASRNSWEAGAVESTVWWHFHMMGESRTDLCFPMYISL